MEFSGVLDTNTQLNRGELDEQSLVSLVSLEEEHTEAHRVHLETCAEEVVCSVLFALGEDGIA